MPPIDPTAVPSGGLLVPTVGVGGHCLPKDGILLWWRALEAHVDASRSLILEARRINDESPEETIRLAERALGPASVRQAVTLLGVAYRFNSEDTRNSPTLVLARLLRERGARVRLHDPYVKPDDQNLRKFGLTEHFTRDIKEAVKDAEWLVMCTAHRDYVSGRDANARRRAEGAWCRRWLQRLPRGGYHQAWTCVYRYRTRAPRPDPAEIDSVTAAFRAVERGLANEVQEVVDFLNDRYASDKFNRVQFADVQKLAGTCVTGCAIVDPGPVAAIPAGLGSGSALLRRAVGSTGQVAAAAV